MNIFREREWGKKREDEDAFRIEMQLFCVISNGKHSSLEKAIQMVPCCSNKAIQLYTFDFN